MNEPIKFDFSIYTAAIPAIPAIREQKPTPKIAESQESQGPKTENAKSFPNQEPFTNSRIARIAEAEHRKILAWLSHIGETDEAMIDDVLAYCASNPDALTYYLKRAEEALSGNTEDTADGKAFVQELAEGSHDPLLVTVFTPNGHAMTVQAKDAENAEWLKRINPPAD